MSVVIIIRDRNRGRVDSVGVQEGVIVTIDLFVWGHVDSIRVPSVRICCHFREGGVPIGLAEFGDVSQSSLELPDIPFSMPIGLVMAGRSHNVFDSHGLKCLPPALGGEWWVSITDKRGRYSMGRKNMVLE